MSTPPKGYVLLLTSVSYKNISRELSKWKTATLSTPNPDGSFDIYVKEEELAAYREELSDSTR